MFENKTKAIEGPGTIVGSNVKLAGTLKDVNDITIHGQVEGEIISEKNVSIEQTAMVKGPVKAKNIVVSGKIIGEIDAYEYLEITETGNISGSINTKKLSIKDGAIFNGKCKMQDDIAKAEKSQPKKEEETETKSDTKLKEESKKDSKDLFKHIGNQKYELE